MIPLYDCIPARRFPIVNVTLIVANFAVFLIYELPNQDSAINQASFYPCDVTHACHLGIPWGVSWITSMFMHANWHHILGNMVFLAVFGKNVECAFGRLGYLSFYLAGGVAATELQTAVTLHFGSATDAQLPNLGASGAIAAVLGAYIVLYPNSRVAGLAVWRPFIIPAWGFLGFWFLFQLFEAGLGLRRPDATSGGGVAFFAHVGGFVFGVAVTLTLTHAGKITAASTTEPKDDAREDYPPPTEDSTPSALAAPGKSTTAAPPSGGHAPHDRLLPIAAIGGLFLFLIIAVVIAHSSRNDPPQATTDSDDPSSSSEGATITPQDYASLIDAAKVGDCFHVVGSTVLAVAQCDSTDATDRVASITHSDSTCAMSQRSVTDGRDQPTVLCLDTITTLYPR